MSCVDLLRSRALQTDAMRAKRTACIGPGFQVRERRATVKVGSSSCLKFFATATVTLTSAS
jgi:hypothetical protein